MTGHAHWHEDPGPQPGDPGPHRNGARRHIDLRAGAVYLSTDIPPVLDGLWLIHNWLPRKGLSVIWGPSGAGKSHLGADMACHIAQGREWHGHPVEPGLVVYIALEGHGSLNNRIAALAQTFGNAPVWFIRAPFSLAETADHVDDLVRVILEEAAARGLMVRCIMIDTLARATAGMEENSARDMGTAIAALEGIAEALDCAVVVIHHSGKDTTRGERGSGALRAAVEASIEVAAEGRGAAKVITASTGKLRDGETEATFTFRLRQIELGIDKWNRPVTSCVVEPLEQAEAAQRRTEEALAKLTPRQRHGLEALRDTIARCGRRITNSEHYPPHRPIVTEDDWRDEFYRRVFDEETKPVTRKIAFQRLREDLRDKLHLVGTYNGHAWTVASGPKPDPEPDDDVNDPDAWR